MGVGCDRWHFVVFAAENAKEEREALFTFRVPSGFLQCSEATLSVYLRDLTQHGAVVSSERGTQF